MAIIGNFLAGIPALGSSSSIGGGVFGVGRPLAAAGEYPGEEEENGSELEADRCKLLLNTNVVSNYPTIVFAYSDKNALFDENRVFVSVPVPATAVPKSVDIVNDGTTLVVTLFTWLDKNNKYFDIQEFKNAKQLPDRDPLLMAFENELRIMSSAIEKPLEIQIPLPYKVETNPILIKQNVVDKSPDHKAYEFVFYVAQPKANSTTIPLTVK